MLNGKQLTSSYWPGFILFLVALAIGLSIYQDYGVSWDEPIQRGMGRVSYNYVFNNDPSLLQFNERSHGVAFELPLIILEKRMHITDQRDIYLMRHLVTHLFFLVSVFFGYILCLRLFKDQFLACLGFVLLAFNPRIYAHSFFNTKDIPFLSAVIILFAITQIAFEKNKRGWYILMAVACAYATSIRVMGILFAACISLFFIADIINAIRRKEKTGKATGNFLLFITVFCGILYATWPILWTRPVFHFKEEFQALSHIYWSGFVLLNGVNYPGDTLPWFYVPEWFSITMPVLWLFAGLTGFTWLLVSFFKKPGTYFENTPQRNFIMYAICFSVPVIAVIALHSILYDDWRHVYFIYPSFVMLILFALQKIATGYKRKIVIVLCILQIGVTSVFMVRNHPFEHIYFNQLVSHKKEFLRTHFDLDYWGCSDMQSLEYILAHDNADSIKVWRSLDPVGNNLGMIPATSRKRIILVDSSDHPAYFITNFRNHPGDYPYTNICFEMKVLNSTILRVYKLP